ncbi:MAG: hypothetical protein ACRDTE_12995 [Pseudonocardiaceae bacterium]
MIVVSEERAAPRAVIASQMAIMNGPTGAAVRLPPLLRLRGPPSPTLLAPRPEQAEPGKGEPATRSYVRS